jgi:hypothetical protein
MVYTTTYYNTPQATSTTPILWLQLSPQLVSNKTKTKKLFGGSRVVWFDDKAALPSYGGFDEVGEWVLCGLIWFDKVAGVV